MDPTSAPAYPSDLQRPPKRRIACLAWGSLIWKPGELRLASPWFQAGAELPIEFCRVDDKGELSTALCDGAATVPTRWALLATDDITEAREALRRREGIPESEATFVGSLPSTVENRPHARVIAEWAAGLQLDGVVWTALPPRFAGSNGRAPSAEEAVAYLDSLDGEVRDRAEHYVRAVPREITTPNRTAIERKLDWQPLD